MPKGIPKTKEVKETKEVKKETYREAPEVTVPQEKEKHCKCGHSEKLHYGGKDGWCNTKGCQCQYLN